MSAGYLLDTSVISALAPGREAHLGSGVAQWLRAHDAQLFLPCVAVAELTQGIGKLRRIGAVDRADRLDLWLNQLIAGFGERILPFDTSTARLAGQISDQATAHGNHPGFADVVIAAIAQQTNHVLLTRNLKHFAPLGIKCFDPFAAGGLPA